MKFVKTAVALAIAGIAAAPMIASADTTLSGVVQVKIQGTDADGDDPDLAAGDARVGIVSEHELNSGITGYGSIQLNADDFTGQNGGVSGLTVPGNPTENGEESEQGIDGTVAVDNVYVGVKGGFGDVRFGEIPLAVEYGQLANDIHDVGGTVVDGISYAGTFGPVSVGVNHSLAEDSDMSGIGAKFNFAGATIGLGFEDRNELANFAAGVSYAIAGVSIGAQTWTQEQAEGDDATNIAIKLGYSISGVSLGLTYSTLELGDTETIIRLDAGYDLGGGTDVSTRIDSTSSDADGSEDALAWRIMLTKAF